LVQQGDKVAVYRDNNKDFSREGDPLDRGFFGINQHHGSNAPRDNIGGHSAGCLVGRMVAGHEEFMRLITQDRRYKDNPTFRFSTTILKAADVMAAKPAPRPIPPVVVPPVAGGVVGTTMAWFDANPTTIALAVVGTVIVVAALFYWFKRKE
jgi:hypothetical protein